MSDFLKYGSSCGNSKRNTHNSSAASTVHMIAFPWLSKRDNQAGA
jgi:hypothetical protein